MANGQKVVRLECEKVRGCLEVFFNFFLKKSFFKIIFENNFYYLFLVVFMIFFNIFFIFRKTIENN